MVTQYTARNTEFVHTMKGVGKKTLFGGVALALAYHNRKHLFKLYQVIVAALYHTVVIVNGNVAEQYQALEVRTSAVRVCNHFGAHRLRSPLDGELLRESFRRIAKRDTHVHKDTNHPHPTCAGIRSTINNLCNEFANDAGRRLISISLSSNDVKQGIAGTRSYYCGKDTAMDFQNDEIRQADILKAIDVDYYLDWSTLKKYIQHCSALLFYTFVPKRVCGPCIEGSYTIRHNKVVVRGFGGYEYEHAIWDFDSDSISIDYIWGTINCKVETVETEDPDRRLVAIFPIATVITPYGWLLPGYRLHRRLFRHIITIMDEATPKTCVINFSKFQTNDLHPYIMLSLSLEGAEEDILIRESVLRSILIRVGMKKDPHIADVERVIREAHRSHPEMYPRSQPEIEAALLYSLLPFLTKELNIPILTSTAELRSYTETRNKHAMERAADDLHYQTIETNGSYLVTEDGLPVGRVACPPLVDNGNLVPVRSHNNDQSCILNRVTLRENTVTVPYKYLTYVAEFNRFIVPDDKMHVGVPWSIDQVMEKQCRPVQVAGALRDLPTAFMHEPRISSFQKAESYTGLKPPRNISTMDADTRTRYSSYIYPFTQDVLKTTEWYVFGKTPEQIADLLHEYVRQSQFVIPTDYTCWDGTHSEFLAKAEIAVMKRWAGVVYHREMGDLLMSQYNASAATKTGVRYNTKWSRPSGSSDTSAFNSYDNALVSYIAIRESNTSPIGAWAKLGLYGGDDGITRDISPKKFTHVATLMGHVLKSEVINPNNAVGFLGRIYLDPWTSNRSISDPLRHIRKLHIVTAPVNVPLEVALYRKAEGYLVTDPTTPILREWAEAIMRFYPDVNDAKYDSYMGDHTSWWAYQVLNSGEVFPTYCTDTQLTNDCVCKQLACTPLELARAVQAINDATSILELPSNVFSITRKVDVAAVVGGEVITPEVPGQVRIEEQENNELNPNANNGNDSPTISDGTGGRHTSGHGMRKTNSTASVCSSINGGRPNMLPSHQLGHNGSSRNHTNNRVFTASIMSLANGAQPDRPTVRDGPAQPSTSGVRNMRNTGGRGVRTNKPGTITRAGNNGSVRPSCGALRSSGADTVRSSPRRSAGS